MTSGKKLLHSHSSNSMALNLLVWWKNESKSIYIRWVSEPSFLILLFIWWINKLCIAYLHFYSHLKWKPSSSSHPRPCAFNLTSYWPLYVVIQDNYEPYILFILKIFQHCAKYCLQFNFSILKGLNWKVNTFLKQKANTEKKKKKKKKKLQQNLKSFSAFLKVFFAIMAWAINIPERAL